MGREIENKTISLVPILMVNFIASMGFSIVLPFLVFLVTRFSGTGVLFGVMAAVYPFFQLIGAPILGRWSDSYGRKKILLLSHAGTTCAWLLMLVALFIPIVPLVRFQTNLFGAFFISVPFIVLLIARALDGITGGNISVTNAYIADVSTDKTRKRNFGRMAVSANLGFIVGPALAGLLGATIYGELPPIIVALGISVVALLVIIRYLPESRKCESMDSIENKKIRKIFGFELKECIGDGDNKRYGLKDVLKVEHIRFLLFLTFLIFLGFNLFYTSFPIHAALTLHWSIPQLGIFFVVLSGLMVVVQGPLLSRLSDRVADSTLIVIGSAVLGTNFLLLVSFDIVVIYLAAVLFAVGNGLMWPSFLSFLSRTAGSKFQGSVQGFASSIGGSASIIGLIVGGILYETIYVNTFLIAAGLIYVVVFFSLFLIRIEKSELKNKQSINS